MDYPVAGLEHEFAMLSPLLLIFIGLFALIISIVGLIINAWVWCKIFKKAGFSWAIGLLALVPLGGSFLALFLAFSKWPISQKTVVINNPG